MANPLGSWRTLFIQRDDAAVEPLAKASPSRDTAKTTRTITSSPTARHDAIPGSQCSRESQSQMSASSFPSEASLVSLTSTVFISEDPDDLEGYPGVGDVETWKEPHQLPGLEFVI